jgi:hypothetical protein
MTPVDEIARILEEAGYRKLHMPIAIAGVSFEFPAAYVGTAPSPDLVLIADTAFESDQRILRKIEGVARALDVVGSRRPVTAVVAGPRPGSATIDALSKVCRVLPIGAPSGGAPPGPLRDWLAVLLPLTIPAPSLQIADPLGRVLAQVDHLHPDVVGLAALAVDGAAAVQDRLHKILEEQLNHEEETP